MNQNLKTCLECSFLFIPLDSNKQWFNANNDQQYTNIFLICESFKMGNGPENSIGLTCVGIYLKITVWNIIR